MYKAAIEATAHETLELDGVLEFEEHTSLDLGTLWMQPCAAIELDVRSDDGSALGALVARTLGPDEGCSASANLHATDSRASVTLHVPRATGAIEVWSDTHAPARVTRDALQLPSSYTVILERGHPRELRFCSAPGSPLPHGLSTLELVIESANGEPSHALTLLPDRQRSDGTFVARLAFRPGGYRFRASTDGGLSCSGTFAVEIESASGTVVEAWLE